MWILTLLTAFATPEAYRSCCDLVSTACPDPLSVQGPGTVSSPDGAGASLRGLWSFSCQHGAFFDPQASVRLTVSVPDGTILTPISPQAAACFEAACALPKPLCLHSDAQGSRAVACGTTAPGTGTHYRSPAGPPSMPVVVRGRVLRASLVTSSPGTPPPASTPVSAATTASPPPPSGDVDLTLPPAPPDPCIPDNALRAASNAQVDEGNEAMLAADLPGAVDKYRAAVTIMRCNAFAWAALGDTFVQLGHNAPAQTALTHATRLMPTHYQAWSNLGLAFERLGQSYKAKEAYQKSLSAKPGYPPATRGLARVAP